GGDDDDVRLGLLQKPFVIVEDRGLADGGVGALDHLGGVAQSDEFDLAGSALRFDVASVVQPVAVGADDGDTRDAKVHQRFSKVTAAPYRSRSDSHAVA